MSARLAQQQIHQSSPSMESKWGDRSFRRLISSSQTWAEQCRTWGAGSLFSSIEDGGSAPSTCSILIHILYEMYWTFSTVWTMRTTYPAQKCNTTMLELNLWHHAKCQETSRDLWHISWFHPQCCAQAPWISHCRCLDSMNTCIVSLNSAHPPNMVDGNIDTDTMSLHIYHLPFGPQSSSSMTAGYQQMFQIKSVPSHRWDRIG